MDAQVQHKESSMLTLTDERLTPQDRFLLSLPVGMRQPYLSQKHIDMPEIFSHVLVVDVVDGSVSLRTLHAYGQLTGHRGGQPSDEVLEKIRPLLGEYGKTVRPHNAEALALETAAKISEILTGVSEKITGSVVVWFFEPGGFDDKKMRVITKE